MRAHADRERSVGTALIVARGDARRGLRLGLGKGHGRPGRTRRLELYEESVAHRAVGRPQAPRNGRARAHILALRVGGPAVDEELVVEMRAGREAGRPDVADRLALLDPLAHVQPAGEPGQMAVARADPVGVPQLD